MHAQDYINDIKGAIDDASQQDGKGTPQVESLLVHLAARGLIVVAIPSGVHLTFYGLPRHA